MIAALRGEVLVRRGDHIIIDASGVGYRLTVSSETLRSVPAAGQEAFLHCETVGREDGISLYGFSSEEERDLFVELIGISGIGPKVAVAVLSGGAVRDLLQAIVAGDAKRFQAVPGIGKRTAERIILELKDRVTSWVEESGEAIPEPDGARGRSLARDGLVNLGFPPLEAEQLLDGLDPEGDPEELIGLALKKAGAAGGSGSR